MKKIKISLIALAIASFTISCEDAKTESSNKEETTAVKSTENSETTTQKTTESIAVDVDANKFKELIESGNGQLIDVRTPGEVAAGSIDGATNIDFNSGNFENDINALDKDVPVYVYCRSGGRSAGAMKIMKANGFKEVYNLLGGYSNWPFK